MIASLTGFGRAEVSAEGISYSVEIRAVNNRFLEVSVRLPRSLAPFEQEFQKRIRQRARRGKISLFIQETRESQRLSRLSFDPEGVQRLVEGLRSLAEESGLKDDLSLSNLIPILDLLLPDEKDEVRQQRLALALQGLDAALDELERMRAEEGANLEEDFRRRLATLAGLVDRIENKSAEHRDSLLEKMRERIGRYVPGEVDEGRLEQEVAYLVDKLDITEETVRLRSHLDLFTAALESGDDVGKRLNFILQEMNREVNTIGSKSASGEVSAWVVQAKEELEKIREQVQNVA